MNVKYSPQQSDDKWSGAVVTDSVVQINATQYRFDVSIVDYDSRPPILEAHRDSSGALYITVLRTYQGARPAWDTGDYHSIAANGGTVDTGAVVMTGRTQAEVDASQAEAQAQAQVESQLEQIRRYGLAGFETSATLFDMIAKQLGVARPAILQAMLDKLHEVDSTWNGPK